MENFFRKTTIFIIDCLQISEKIKLYPFYKNSHHCILRSGSSIGSTVASKCAGCPSYRLPGLWICVRNRGNVLGGGGISGIGAFGASSS